MLIFIIPLLFLYRRGFWGHFMKYEKKKGWSMQARIIIFLMTAVITTIVVIKMISSKKETDAGNEKKH
jgi:hypothetical protein